MRLNFKNLLTTILLVTLSVAAFAQPGPGGRGSHGPRGQRPAPKEAFPVINEIKGNPFTGIKKIEDAGSAQGNALWIDGSKLYYGASNTLYIYDISTPLEPKKLGECALKGLCRQIAVKDGIVYVACRETGLWIVDAKNPAAPSIITRYDAVELATGVDVAGDVLFIGQRQNGVEFVDVSDPAHPEHIYLQKTSESQSVWYRDGILYSGDWGQGEITVIDAHDMSAIQVLNKVPMNGYGDGVFTSGKYLYAATGHHSKDKTKTKEENFGNGHALEVFDISDPANPVRLSRTQFGTDYTRGNDYWTPRPNGDLSMCFISDTSNGLYVVDIKKPSKPKIIGRITFDTKTGEHTPVSSVAVADGAVYVASWLSGLYVAACPKAKAPKIDKGKAPENVSARHQYTTSASSHFLSWTPEKRAQVRGAASNGDVIYAACSDAGLAILKQGADGSLQQIGKGKASFAGDVKVMDGKLYVAEGLDGLAIYDIKGETQLEEVCRKQNLGFGIDLCLWVWPVSKDFIAVSGRYRGNVLLDARNFPELKPVMIVGGAPGWDKYLPEKVCKDNLLPYNRANHALLWIDLAAQKPGIVFEDKFNAPTLSSGVSNYKDGKAIICMKRQLRILEPGMKYESDAPGVSGDFEGAPQWDGGNLLCLNARINREIRLLDVTDDAAPKMIFKEKMKGNPEKPTFFKGKLLVPCGYQGLLLQK